MFQNADLPARAVHSNAAARPARRPRALPCLALSLILGVGLMSGCQTPYELGLSELRDGQFSVAEQHAKRGLSEDPQDPELNLLLARALVAQKNYRHAEAYAEVAFRAGTHTATAGRVLGKIQWELGRTMDAAMSWKSARQAQADIVADEDYQRALESALRTAKSIQNFEKTLEFRIALAELAPDHPEADPLFIHSTRALHAAQLKRQGAFEDSARVYEVLLEEQPGNKTYILTLAQIHEKLGDLDTSREVYARYLSPVSGPERTERMIEISMQSNASENSRYYRRKAYESLLDGPPSDERAELAMQLAADSYQQNEDEQAKEYIDKAINDRAQLRPDSVDIEIYFRATSLAISQNRPKHALEFLERGQALAPTNWQLTEQLAGLYTRRARSADVERVLAEFVDSSQEPFEARLLVSRWANARRNYDLAQHFMERAIEDAEPLDATIWLELARIYAAQGRTDRLKVALTNYTKPAKRTTYELMNAAKIYRDARLYKEAEELLIRAQKASPRDIGVFDGFALLYKAWAKPEKIEPYYDRWIAAGGSNAEDYTMIGRRLIQQGEPTRAIRYFRKGAEAGDVDAWLRIATIYSNQRRNIDMRQALQRYIEASEATFTALRTAQRFYRTAGMASDEIEVLETLLPQMSSDASGAINDYSRLAELYLQQGRQEAATTLWTEYLSQEVGSEARLNEASKWFERTSNPSLALSVYTRLFEGGNPNPIIYKYIGDTYLSIVDNRALPGNVAGNITKESALERARHFYRLFLREGAPSRTELLDFAAHMVRTEHWGVAAETYEALLKDQPDDAPLWLNYGQVLLKTGQVRQGIDVLARYAEQRKGSVADTQRVADALISASLYREAQPYLEQIFQSSSAAPAQKDYALRRLFWSYRQTRRTDQLPALAERYLAQSQNPTQARREVVNMLRDVGMYGEAVAQITRIRASQGEVLGRELAENYFYDAQFDEAYREFTHVARAHPYPGDAWVQTARFYVNHGRAQRAEQAFDEAVNAAPDRANVHLAYGVFLLRRGEFERALERLERARELVTEGQRDELEFEVARALNEVGRFDLGAEIARAALERPTQGFRDDFIRMLASYQLATLPAEQAQRSIDLLKKSGLPLDISMGILQDNGYEAEAAQWLQEAMSQSASYNAGQLLASNTTLLTATGGFDKLEMAFKPLIENQDESTNANASLGYSLMRQGDFTRAISYLQAAEAGGFTPASDLLADAYAALGLEAKALQQYQKLLATKTARELSQTLTTIGAHLELRGQQDVFIRLLRTQINDMERAPVAMPILIKSLIQADQIAQAFELIHRIVPAADPTSEAPAYTGLDTRQDSDMALLVGMLNALAEEGYIIEARAILERVSGQLSAEMRQSQRLRDLSLRLSAVAPADPEAIALSSAPDALAAYDKLAAVSHSARVLLANGHIDAAESLVREALPQASGKAHQRLGDLLLSVVAASGETQRLDEVIKTVIESSGDSLDTTKRLIWRLRALGEQKRAGALALTLAEEQPTDRHVQLLLDQARDAEDIDTLSRARDWLLQVGGNPILALKAVLEPSFYQHPAELGRVLYAPVLGVEPATRESRFFSIFMDFRAADVEAARAGIGAYLQAVNFDPYAVQLLLAHLDKERLFVETARVLAPQLDGHPTSTLSHLYIGVAHHQIGQMDAAKAEFARYIERSADPARAASRVAQLMIDAESFEEAHAYAEQSIAANPNFLTPYYFRGIARLRLGDVEAGRADIARAIGTGVDRFVALYSAAYHALKAGHDDLAGVYLESLIETPMITLNNPGATLAIRALIEADRAEMGLAFMEQKYPQIAAGTGNLGEQLLVGLSTLYSAAGRTERAHQLYESGVARALASDPLGRRANTYMNNLAYGYATEKSPSEATLTRGLDLVRRAIAGTEERSSSFLDTLGWLYFRSHDLDRAETYLRSAVAGLDASEGSFGELFEHIIAIDEARGRPDRASWHDIHRQGMK